MFSYLANKLLVSLDVDASSKVASFELVQENVLLASRVIPFSSQPVGSVLGVSTRPMLGTGGGGKLFCKMQPTEDNWIRNKNKIKHVS